VVYEYLSQHLRVAVAFKLLHTLAEKRHKSFFLTALKVCNGFGVSRYGFLNNGFYKPCIIGNDKAVCRRILLGVNGSIVKDCRKNFLCV